MERVESELIATRVDLADLTIRMRTVESGSGQGYSSLAGIDPDNLKLSPDTTRRIAQALAELGGAASDAAKETVFEAAVDAAIPLTEMLTELLREEAKRALRVAMKPEPVVAGRAPVAAAPAATAPAFSQPAMPAATAPAAAPSVSAAAPSSSAAPPEMDEAAAPLTLDSLDDPFLDALIQEGQLAT